MNDLKLVAILLGPSLVGALALGLCVRFGWLRSLATPIDRGRTVRGRPLFGANKTWRGVVAVAVGTGAGYAILAAVGVLPGGVAPSFGTGQFAFIGACVGGAGMLAELPNSFLKRQLGLAPGTAPTGWASPIFWFLDQVDLLLGAWLVLGPILGFSWSRILWSVALVALVHPLVSLLGVGLGMRKVAR